MNILSNSHKDSAEIFAKKKQVRQQIRALKLQISENQKQQEAKILFSKIETLPEFKAAKSVLLYWSTPDELPTREIVEKWSRDKQVILPTVDGDDLILKQYHSNEVMKQGLLGIWEPDSAETFVEKIDLVIVPGVAFDRKKNRLGRGKGYYDRFFKNNNPIKIGVGFDFQLLNVIPSTEMDIKMDKIITASYVID